MSNEKKEIYVGDIVLEKHDILVDLVRKNSYEALTYAKDLKSALEFYDLNEISDDDLNKIISIFFGCLDSVEFLDESGTRRAYDYWLETNHEQPNEYSDLFDKIVERYKDDNRILDLMIQNSGFVVLDALLEDTIDGCWNILESNEETEHRSFVIDDVEKEKLEEEINKNIS